MFTDFRRNPDLSFLIRKQTDEKERDTPGGHRTPSKQTIIKYGHVAGKIFNQKKWQREKRDRERKHRELLEQWGVTEQDLRRWYRHALAARSLTGNDPVLLKRYGREAAYEDRCNEELCRKQIGKYARESAKRMGDDIGEIVDRYETIVMEFRAARPVQPDGTLRSLSALLRDDHRDDNELKDLLSNLGNRIHEYVCACIRGERDCFDWSLEGLRFSEALVNALSAEYVRDRQGLMRFLSAVFQHWRKVDQSDSLFRQRLITQQHLGAPKVVAQYLQTLVLFHGVRRQSKLSRCGQELSSTVREIEEKRSQDAKKRGDRICVTAF